jgi:hypothetical protein
MKYKRDILFFHPVQTLFNRIAIRDAVNSIHFSIFSDANIIWADKTVSSPIFHAVWGQLSKMPLFIT